MRQPQPVLCIPEPGAVTRHNTIALAQAKGVGYLILPRIVFVDIPLPYARWRERVSGRLIWPVCIDRVLRCAGGVLIRG